MSLDTVRGVLLPWDCSLLPLGCRNAVLYALLSRVLRFDSDLFEYRSDYDYAARFPESTERCATNFMYASSTFFKEV